MKISYNWLREYIDIHESPEAISEILTKAGLEVEKLEHYESIPGGLKGLVVGEVLTCEKHPGADKLKKTTVNIGGVVLPIVCGAANVAAGQKVIVATVGAVLYPKNSEPFTISKAKIRGEISEGMICAEDEIGLGNSHDGIIVLDSSIEAGTNAHTIYNVTTDSIFEIGLTPNRADAASHLGVARDLKALLNREIKNYEAKNFKTDNTLSPVEVIIENKEACSRYAGLTMCNVTVSESPDWLKNKLKSIGLSPINNVVDITNFILHDLGQPLHAFDLDKISGKKIIVKTLEKETEFISLDGEKRKIIPTDLMICDAEKPLCIAGVFGGKESGVSLETKNIFLESACFSPVSIRKTSQQHGLKTDASFRFERGTDPNMPVIALKKAAALIKEVTGGIISSEIVDIYPTAAKNFLIEILYKNIDRLIGQQIDKTTIKQILTNLGISILKESEEALSLSVPPFKVDVLREADIAEEILRIYGYDNIIVNETISSDFLATFPEKDKDKMQSVISAVLIPDGFHEITTNSLTKPAYASHLKLEDQNVSILNGLSEDLSVLRQSLVFSGLEVLAYNINRKQKDLKVFEFGKTYHRIGEKYIENNRLAIFISGNVKSESWLAGSENVNFYFLKNEVSKILSRLNISNYQSEQLSDGLYKDGMVIIKNTKQIVRFGQVDEKALKLADIKQTVFYADIDMDWVLKNYSNKIVFTEIAKFPEVRRDLSLVIDKKVSFDQIKNLASQVERKLLKDINVFDVFEGEKIGNDKKSYSISFILQDFEQTLTDKMIDSSMQKLISSFEKDLGAIIRK